MVEVTPFWKQVWWYALTYIHVNLSNTKRLKCHFMLAFNGHQSLMVIWVVLPMAQWTHHLVFGYATHSEHPLSHLRSQAGLGLVNAWMETHHTKHIVNKRKQVYIFKARTGQFMSSSSVIQLGLSLFFVHNESDGEIVLGTEERLIILFFLLFFCLCKITSHSSMHFFKKS